MGGIFDIFDIYIKLIQSAITEAGIVVRTEKFEEVTDFHAVENTKGRISLLSLRCCCTRGRGRSGRNIFFQVSYSETFS